MDGKKNSRIFVEFMIFIKSDSIRILLTYYKVHLDRIQGFEEKLLVDSRVRFISAYSFSRGDSTFKSTFSGEAALIRVDIWYFVTLCLHSAENFLMYAFQGYQGCRAFSCNLAHFVNQSPCHGRDLPAASCLCGAPVCRANGIGRRRQASGTHGVLPGVLLLFRAVPS